MPQFMPGEAKTAKATMRNPTARAFDYEGVIYLGTDLQEMSRQPFSLNASEERVIGFPIIMPGVPGVYPVHIGVFSGGKSIGLYRATEDVQIAQAAIEIAKAYIRMEYPSVSEAYSGWIGISPVGSELNLALFGGRIQVGVLLRNPTQAPLKYICTIYNYHWIEPNNYTTDYLTLPSVQPKKISYFVCGACGSPFYLYDYYEENAVCPYCGAISGPTMAGNPPTGLPYSGYQYECDMFLPPGGELPPGKTGFVYSDLSYQSRRWNYLYIEITCNGYALGRALLYSGWYSY